MMFELLAAKLGGAVFGNIVQIGATGIAGWVFLFLARRIDNDKIKTAIRVIFYPVGVAITLGLAKWKWTKRWWNKWGEPWLVDLLDNTIVEAVRAIQDGMRSDN